MKNSWIIAKRDLGSFFNSPIFYVITTVFLIIYSYIFVTPCLTSTVRILKFTAPYRTLPLQHAAACRSMPQHAIACCSIL